MGHLLDALSRTYEALGFPQVTGHDEVFRQLVLAGIIEPASEQDSLRVLEEAGVPAPSYPTLNRRLPVWAGLVLYDVQPLSPVIKDERGGVIAGERVHDVNGPARLRAGPFITSTYPTR
jgi:hypothetical protein